MISTFEGKSSYTTISIETERLRLRPFVSEDFDDLFDLFSDPAVMTYLHPARPLETYEVRVALDSMIRHWERHGFGRCALILKETGKMIGFGGLRSLDGVPEVVYALARRYWNKGLATESAKASLRFGFEQFGFEKIVAITKPDNLVSRHILAKIGLLYQCDTVFYGHHLSYYEIGKNQLRMDNSYYCLSK